MDNNEIRAQDYKVSHPQIDEKGVKLVDNESKQFAHTKITLNSQYATCDDQKQMQSQEMKPEIDYIQNRAAVEKRKEEHCEKKVEKHQKFHEKIRDDNEGQKEVNSVVNLFLILFGHTSKRKVMSNCHVVSFIVTHGETNPSAH